MRPVTVLLAAVLLAACGSQPNDFMSPVQSTSTPPDTTQPSHPSEAPDTTRPLGPADVGAEVEAARTRWEAAGLVTYSYRFLDDCGECDQLPEQRAVVWEGEVMDPIGRIASVVDAFDLIERALARGEEVEVTFDSELGYPTDLWIDREARAHDGGTHLVFSAVEPGLPGEPASLEDHRDARILWERAALTSYEYSSAVVCDCEYQVAMHTTVVDGRVAGFDFRTPGPTDITFSPLTIAQMFDDVEAFLEGEEFPDEGIRVTGSAQYDERYGYPVWIGLDIDVVDPVAAAEAGLPARLVMTVSDLAPLESDPTSEVERARALWAAHGLDSYSFGIVFHDVAAGDFTDEFTVEVVDGVIASVVQNDYELSPGDVEIPTIDEVFDWIATLHQTGATVDAIYDAELGYPALVVVIRPDGTDGTISISLRR